MVLNHADPTERRYACAACRAVFKTGFARCPIDGSGIQELVDDPLAGTSFADRYVIEDCIGEGGMGRVYRARHQRVSRRFAIKVLYGEHATDAKERDRFSREAEAASRLEHPNVISVVDFGETEHGLLYLVMDYVEGRELARVVRSEAPFGRDRIADILRQLCSGLQHAHEEGLVHRDFKSENILLTMKSGREVPRIVDFGIAVMAERLDSERLTTEGLVVGTPVYMSPEQAMGRDVDHRTDLFSLGVILYEMIAWELPFDGTPIEIARQNMTLRPPAIRDRVPGLVPDAKLEAIALRLMEKDPADRFQSANEVIDALAAPDRVVVPPPVQTDGRAAPDERHIETDHIAEMAQARRRRMAMAGVCAVALLGLLAIGVGLGGEDAASSPPAGAPPAPALPSSVTAAAGPDAAALALAPSADASAPPPAGPVVVSISERPGRPETLRSAPRERRKPGSASASPTAQPPIEPATKAPSVEPPTSAAIESPAPPAKITQRSLTDLYVSVGESIEALARAQGESVVTQLRSRYKRIPFQDAIRKDSMRPEVDGDLRKLRKDVAALRQR